MYSENQSFTNKTLPVYPVYPYRKDVPRGFLQNAVSEARRDIAVDRQEKSVINVPVDEELHGAVKVCVMSVNQCGLFIVVFSKSHTLLKQPRIYLSEIVHSILSFCLIGKSRSSTPQVPGSSPRTLPLEAILTIHATSPTRLIRR
jgi:hypothetical protein